MPSGDITMLEAYVTSQLPNDWAHSPGGWPGEIEAALIDAVLSIRANYGGPSNGVRGAVTRWRTHRDSAQIDDLEAIALFDATLFSNALEIRQVLSGGLTKPAAIQGAADALLSAGVRRADDLDPESSAHRAAYESIKGLGPVTWDYFTMLLGSPGIKADTWILRFVEAALGRRATSSEASLLLKEVAAVMGVDPRVLDHAIWSHVRAHAS